MLSPDHAVFVEDVLIPIRLLTNGITITRAMVDAVTYYHIELDQHDIVLAEGLPVESYLETGSRHAFENGGPHITMYPDFSVRAWEAYGCAPLVVHGEVLARARTKLKLQAESPDGRGWRQTA